MLIKNIPYKKVRENAIRYIWEQYPTAGYEADDSTNFIRHEETKEGEDFWRAVCIADFERARAICPEMFEEGIVELTYDLSHVPLDELKEWLVAANKELERRQKSKQFKVVVRRFAGPETATIYIDSCISPEETVSIKGCIYLVESCEEVEQ